MAGCLPEQTLQALELVIKRLALDQSRCHFSQLADIRSISLTCTYLQQIILAIPTRLALIIWKRANDPLSLLDLTSWLPQHEKHVRSLKLVGDPLWHLNAAPAAVANLSATAAAAFAAAPGLELMNFSSNIIHHTPILLALPVTVTRLELSHCLGEPQHTAHIQPFTAALTRLTALNTMSLGTTVSSSSVPQHVLFTVFETLQTLPSLAHLILQRTEVSEAAASRLPAQLTRLALDACKLPMGMSLAHLTSLLELDLVGPQPPDFEAVHEEAVAATTAALPPSLTSLTCLTTQRGHAYLTLEGLTNLQQLDVVDSTEHATQLAALANMATLKCMRLRHLHGRALETAAPTWAHLPTLQALELSGNDIGLHSSTATRLDTIISHVAATTALTALTVHHLQPKLNQVYNLRICAAVSSLQNLASLELRQVTLAAGDALHLTVLTNLTSLAIADSGGSPMDTAAVAICMLLRNLQHLRFSSRGICSMAMLFPAALVLMGLRSLCVEGGSGCCVDAAGLGVLSGLTQLSELSLPGQRDLLSAEVRSVRHHLPDLQRVTITNPR